MKVQIAHHKMKLRVKMGVERSWIKEGQCEICDEEGKNCKKNESCFSSNRDPKVKCDSAYCEKNEDYSKDGISGVDV